MTIKSGWELCSKLEKVLGNDQDAESQKCKDRLLKTSNIDSWERCSIVAEEGKKQVTRKISGSNSNLKRKEYSKMSARLGAEKIDKDMKNIR